MADSASPRIIEKKNSDVIKPYEKVGDLSPSPRPLDDFRVKFNVWIFRCLTLIVILTEIITTPTPMLADSAIVQSLVETKVNMANKGYLVRSVLALLQFLLQCGCLFPLIVFTQTPLIISLASTCLRLPSEPQFGCLSLSSLIALLERRTLHTISWTAWGCSQTSEMACSWWPSFRLASFIAYTTRFCSGIFRTSVVHLCCLVSFSWCIAWRKWPHTFCLDM